MKRTVTILISLLAAAAMLLSLSACGGQKGASADPLMQSLLEKLTANEEYAQWKATFNATTIEEKLDGNSIVFSAKGDEGVNGDFTFTLDGDYIVNTAAANDYSSYAFLMYLKDALADHYGMNSLLMSGYLAGLDAFGLENKYLLSETEGDQTVWKLYAASAWEMKELDEMYVNDAALEPYDALGEEEISLYVNAGKISAMAFGNADQLELVVGEYGGNTDLSYQSIRTIVNKLQPRGAEAFTASVTALEETSGEGYAVSNGIPDEVRNAHDFTPADGYSYVTVVFSSGESGNEDDSSEDSSENTQPTLTDFEGDYAADRCTVTVAAEGETDAKITVHWGSSATEAVEYTMHGAFNADTYRITYSDSEKKEVTYDENGDVVSDTVVYSDGVGRLQFFNDGTMQWQDEQEADRLAGMTFEKLD